MECYKFAKQQQKQRLNRFDTDSESSESETEFEQNYDQERYIKRQPLRYQQQTPKAFYTKKTFEPEQELEQEEEEEERYTKKQPFDYEEREQKPRKWVIVIDVEKFLPEDIDTEVDPIYHTLTISAKRLRQPTRQQLETEQEEERFYTLERVIPLPRNVNARKLRMKYTPRGELLVKAPYQRNEENVEEEEEERRWLAAPTYFSQQKQQQQLRRGRYTIPVTFSKKSQLPLRREQQQLFYTPEFLQPTMTTKKTYATRKMGDIEYVRDETTGQWKVLLNINVVGFRPEEVRVNFEEQEHVLLIEARHQLRREQFDQLKGIAPKTLRREFVLPEWLEATQMRYRVLKTGMLCIELPCLRNPKQIQKQLFENFCCQF